MRVVRLRVEAFSKRTGNVLKPEMTAVLNDLDGKPLTQGQLLKIARSEVYRSR